MAKALALFFAVSALCGYVSAPKSFAQVVSSREEVIHLDLRFMGADLLDEMVWSWLKTPPFTERRRLTLAEVVAPVGLDDRFRVDIENRFFELLTANPQLPITLTHCGICSQLVTKSTPQATVMSRGIDQPEVLERLYTVSPDLLALSLYFEAEGRELVLRAQIWALSKGQPVLWSRTYSTSVAARRVLREAEPLLSLAEAREEQNKIINGRDQVEAVTRMFVRTFSGSGGGTPGGVDVVPMLFAEQSIEGVMLPDRRRRLGLGVGYTSLDNALTGWSVGGHFSQLIGAKRPSLSKPDLYWILGYNYIRVRGPGALPFAEKQLDVARIMQARDDDAEPRATIVGWRTGLELHAKHLYGAFGFIEYFPLLKKSEVFEQKALLGIPYQAYGAGILLRW